MQMYKEPKPFKSFEFFYNNLRMAAKMHFYVLLLSFAIQQIFIILASFILRIDLFTAEQYFFTKSLIIVVITYILILQKFKQKSKNIIQDQHLRGTRIISDEELRKIVLDDIKHERRF